MKLFSTFNCDFSWGALYGRERVVCGGREKIFGCRNTNKTKVGFFLVSGAFLGKNQRGGRRVKLGLI